MSAVSARSNVSSSVFRALAILEYVLGADTPPGQRELADHFGIPASSLAALLAALRQKGYVTTERGVLKPGARLLSLGHLAARHAEVLDVRRALQVLVDRTGETAFFSIEVEDPAGGVGNVLPVEQIESEDEIRYRGVLGRAMPMLGSMAGRAILAFSGDEEQWHRVLAADPDVDTAAMVEELRRVRRIGAAISLADNETALATVTLAAPVLRDDRVVGAISIAGPAARMSPLLGDIRAVFADLPVPVPAFP